VWIDHSYACPYCGEALVAELDPSIANQRYVEDCAVCCQPIVIAYTLDENEEVVEFSAERE
jgi:transcription elongation factor Elf1